MSHRTTLHKIQHENDLLSQQIKQLNRQQADRKEKDRPPPKNEHFSQEEFQKYLPGQETQITFGEHKDKDKDKEDHLNDKVKTLELRLKGANNTIQSLQQQLANQKDKPKQKRVESPQQQDKKYLAKLQDLNSRLLKSIREKDCAFQELDDKYRTLQKDHDAMLSQNRNLLEKQDERQQWSRAGEDGKILGLLSLVNRLLAQSERVVSVYAQSPP